MTSGRNAEPALQDTAEKAMARVAYFRNMCNMRPSGITALERETRAKHVLLNNPASDGICRRGIRDFLRIPDSVPEREKRIIS
ncbi:MAG: hypothetical protein DRH37_03885 [Deltaproteobacteria bacterium]|nr:MAG: hypothetical protein DRH37_03885 [Deltaproteobacteria bacterium]